MSIKKVYGIIGVVLVFLVALIYYKNTMTLNTQPDTSSQIRYVALGDSYTIGEGIDKEFNYPSLLVKKLQHKNIAISLVSNPSVSGYTTQNLIDFELQSMKESRPDFVTLLIGANDVVRQIDKDTFRSNLIVILNTIQIELSNKKNIIVITIPDFSVVPAARQFGDLARIKTSIEEFNTIIKEEAQNRDLIVVDIFDISSKMGQDQSLILSDNLHPSTAEYEKWAEKIAPVAEQILQ